MNKKNLELSLVTTGAIYKNETGQIIIEAKNKSFLPFAKIKVNLFVNNELTGKRENQEIIFALKGKGFEQIPIDITSEHCGRILVQIKQAIFYDFFGIVSIKKQFDVNSNLYVLPNQFPIVINVHKSFVKSDEKVLQTVMNKGNINQEIVDIREYLPQDNIRHIHWNLTGKFNELIIKEISDLSDNSYLVLLETSLYEKNKFETPKVVDATMDALYSVSNALFLLKENYSIGWLEPKTGELLIETVTSKEQLSSVLKMLLKLKKVYQEESTIGKFLSGNERFHYSHVIYITTENSYGFLEQLTNQDKVTILVCSEKTITPLRANEQILTPEKIEDELNQLII